MQKVKRTGTLPMSIMREDRYCFGIAYFASEADAMRYDTYVRSQGKTYNGGYSDGMACGRDRAFDKEENVLGTRMKLFAVTD